MATIKFKLAENSPAHFIALANLTIENLGWEVSVYNEQRLTASINHSEYHSSYSVFTIVIKNNEVTLTCIDDLIIAENSRNKVYLNKFLSHYEYTKQLISEKELKKMANKILDANVPIPILNLYKIDSFKSFLKIFIPSRLFFVTTIILDINILIYVVMLASSGFFFKNFDQETLIAAGAYFKPAIISGEWWRLLTAIFLHSNFPHILMNMIMLFYIGAILEPAIGHIKFAIIYILTGFFANLISFYLTDYTLTVGASGAIFGLLGVFSGMLTNRKIAIELRKFIIINIVAITIMTTVNGFLKGSVNYVAHFAGLFCGAVLTIIYLQINNIKSDKFSAQTTKNQ